MVYLVGCVHCYMDVDVYMGGLKDIEAPRMKLIKALCREKYEEKPSAIQIMAVITENGLQRYKEDGRKRNPDVIKTAMKEAYNKLRNQR